MGMLNPLVIVIYSVHFGQTDLIVRQLSLSMTCRKQRLTKYKSRHLEIIGNGSLYYHLLTGVD